MKRPADYPRSPRSTLEYCVSAMGKTLSALMDGRFESHAIVYAGEESRSAHPGGELCLRIIVGNDEECMGYVFDRDFVCFKVCIYVEEKRVIDDLGKFFDTELTKTGGNVWLYRSEPAAGGNSVIITMGPHEALGHIIIFCMSHAVRTDYNLKSHGHVS